MNHAYNLNLKIFYSKKIYSEGFVIVPKERKLNDSLVVTYLPFTLFPTPFKRIYYEQVFNLQPDINQLVYKLANSPLILERAFEK